MPTSPTRPTTTPTGTLSRRDLLRGMGGLALGGAATAALTGCRSPFATGTTGVGPPANSLTFWNLFSGGDGTRMVEMLNGYSKATPKEKLEAVTLTWGNPYYTKLSLAVRGNRPPDVAISHLTRMKVLAEANLLAPLDESALARHGITKDRLNQKAWEACSVNNKLYAIPLDTHPYVLYYNTAVCKKAGLLDSDGILKPPHGPDELVAALKAMKKVTGQYGLVLATVNDTSSCWRLFATLYWQQGGAVLADNGATVAIDDDKALTALNLIKKISVDEQLMPGSVDDNGTTIVFSKQQAGFLFDGEWDNVIYTTDKTPYSMTRFPQVYGDTYVVQADSHTFVLPRDAGRDSRRLDVCLGFVRTMLDQSYTWAQGGHIPAWIPTRDSSKYKSLKPQSNYADVADFVHYDDAAWYSGSGSDLENVVGSLVSSVAAGGLSPSAALKQMHSRLGRYARTPSPV